MQCHPKAIVSMPTGERFLSALTWASHTWSLSGDRFHQSYSPCPAVPPAVVMHCLIGPETGHVAPVDSWHWIYTTQLNPVFSEMRNKNKYWVNAVTRGVTFFNLIWNSFYKFFLNISIILSNYITIFSFVFVTNYLITHYHIQNKVYN